MKFTVILAVAAVIFISGCGKKEESTTTTNTTNNSNLTPTNPVPTNKIVQTDPVADSLKKLLTAQTKKDSIQPIKTADTTKHEVKSINAVDRIKDFLREEFKSEKKPLGSEDRKFGFEPYDLSGTGKIEYLVALTGPSFCSKEGCTMMILDAEFKFNTKMLFVNFPVYVSESKKTNGWKDIYVQSGKGYHRLIYSKTQYPSNPPIEPDFDLNSDQTKTEHLKKSDLKKYSF